MGIEGDEHKIHHIWNQRSIVKLKEKLFLINSSTSFMTRLALGLDDTVKRWIPDTKPGKKNFGEGDLFKKFVDIKLT